MKSTKDSLKILMTTETRGEIWNYALDLIQAVHPYDVHVVLATMGEPLNYQQKKDVCKLRNVRLEESGYRMKWMHPAGNDAARAGVWLLELEEKYRPDIIHLNNYAHGFLPFRAPVISAVHTERFVRKVKDMDGVLGADVVITPTRSMMAKVNQFPGGVEDRHVIRYGRNAENFSKEKKMPFIFSTGKACDFEMLEVAATSCKWPIFVAGEHESKKQLKKRPFQHLHFLGNLTRAETAKWLSQASIYVMAGSSETTGFSVIEAAMSSCALVLGNQNNLREQWNSAAFFVDSGSPESLGKTLQMLQQDEYLRKAVADAAFRRSRKFRSDKMASEYMLTYLQAMEKRKILQPVSILPV